MTETKQRFVVEGSWDDGNEGTPITVDWIAAATAQEAEAIVDKVRNKIDPWTHDCTRTFEDYIQVQQRILDDMKSKTIEQVEDSWAETKENLYYEEDEDEDEDENEEKE